MDNNIVTYSDILSSIKDLLEHFKKLAPGTYRHCEKVAELCDAISDEIPELDKDRLHLAARLHDIGKTYQASYFTENQLDDVNIHDNLDILTSYQIISRHVSDSIAILVEYSQIDRRVLEIISQHHGDSCIKSLVNKCSNEDEKQKLRKELRYKHQKPKTIEACVLMICDVVEAATKSMFTNNKLDDIDKVVNTLIDNLINDCQIDYLTIGQLRKIRQILISHITSIYHSRITYDDENEDINTNDISK